MRAFLVTRRNSTITRLLLSPIVCGHISSLSVCLPMTSARRAKSGPGVAIGIEGKYWLDRILSLIQARGWTCLFVPVPAGGRTLGNRKSGFYPGEISNELQTSAVMFLNPSEAFVNAHLDTLINAEERGERPSGCLLYNEKIRDGHFSALGAQVWAEAVGRRLALLIEMREER